MPAVKPKLGADKKLHWLVMALGTMFLAFALEVGIILACWVLMAFFHWRLSAWQHWQKMGLVFAIDLVVSVMKEVWDSGALNGWLPTILDKNPITGFDTLDLGFSFAGMLTGMVAYAGWLWFRGWLDG